MPQLNYLDKNIYFYSLLKILLQVKPNSLTESITSVNQLVVKSKKRNLILTWNNLKEYQEFTVLFPLAWQLLTFKEWVIKRTKQYLQEYKFPEIFSTIKDKLSLTYDDLSLTAPHSYRTLASIISSNGKKQVFSSDGFWKTISKEKEEIFSNNNLKERLIQEGIHGLPLISLIIDESVNQSIKSQAGTHYHERVKETFNKLTDCQLISEKKIDSKKRGVEYDFIYSYQGKRIGISAKRTLRERWKQNWDDCANLEVDTMFLITLGTDLNENKAQIILSYQGWHIIVAQEVYEDKEYLKNNVKVLSSEKVKNNFLKNLL